MRLANIFTVNCDNKSSGLTLSKFTVTSMMFYNIIGHIYPCITRIVPHSPDGSCLMGGVFVFESDGSSFTSLDLVFLDFLRSVSPSPRTELEERECFFREL